MQRNGCHHAIVPVEPFVSGPKECVLNRTICLPELVTEDDFRYRKVAGFHVMVVPFLQLLKVKGSEHVLSGSAFHEEDMEIILSVEVRADQADGRFDQFRLGNSWLTQEEGVCSCQHGKKDDFDLVVTLQKAGTHCL